MGAKGILLTLFLYTALVWVWCAYKYPDDLAQKGLLFTAAGIAVTLLYVIGTWIWSYWREARAKAAAKPAQPVKAVQPLHEDDRALMELLQTAALELAQAPAYAGRKTQNPLSGLPVYLIVGPEGSGKTAAFVNAGLEPQPLSGQGRLDNAPPTRMANIWLAKNAIFIELGGRHFSGDLARWEQLLKILRGSHETTGWRRILQDAELGPELRGVISFSDFQSFLASSNPSTIEQPARNAREKLLAVGKVFRRSFPVYNIFTRTDLVPYFADFFTRMPESDAGQPFGSTLQIAVESESGTEAYVDVETNRIARAFSRIYASLADRRVPSLYHELNPGKRPNIYEFPREFRRVRQGPVDYLVQVFRPNPLQPGPVNRGFYFSATRRVEAGQPSAAQMPADAISATTQIFKPEATQLFRPDATQMFRPDVTTVQSGPHPQGGGRPAGPLQTRWMFLTDLFHEIIIPDRVLTAAAPIPDATVSRQRSIAFGAVAAMAGLLGIIFLGSWIGNRNLLARVDEAAVMQPAAKADAAGLPSLDSLKALEALRARLEELMDHNRNGRPWSLRAGLYSGDAVLPDVRRDYFQRLRNLELGAAHSRLVADLTGLPAKPDDRPSKPILDRLKSHIMMSSGGCNVDEATLSGVLKEALRANGFPPADPRTALAEKQAEFYAKEMQYGNPIPFAESPEARDRAALYVNQG
ncbi:MAG: type VI secretion protein IcmF/TssM N-terminal domain-containing protein, partial [Bryobacteraceae bacterium]